MVLEGAGREAAEELAKLGGDVAGQLNVRLLEANQILKDFKASMDRVLAVVERAVAVLERLEKKLGDTGITIRL